MQLALEDCESVAGVSTVTDGRSALRYLRSTDNPDDHLVLLDLGMPRMSGFDVLSEIRADPDLEHTPVIVFTGSSRKRDVTEARAPSS